MLPCGCARSDRAWSRETDDAEVKEGQPLPGSSAEEAGARLREVLKERGLRYSRPRELILGYMLEKDRHVNAEGLYMELKRRGEELSLSTVYLNLSTLSDAGLLREYKTPAGQSFYDSNVTPHHHVVCRETGEVIDVPTPMIDGVPLGRYLKAYVEARTGWTVDEPRLSLTGLSPENAKKRDD